MAKVYVKRRRAPIELPNDRAVKVKRRWLGVDGVEKASESAMLDLGEWAGLFGEIVGVDLDPVREQVEDHTEKLQREELAEHERIMKMSPQGRAEASMGFFGFRWYTRSSMTQKEVPEKVREEAIVIAEAWFKAHPNESRLPAKVHESLLKLHWGEARHRAGQVVKPMKDA